MMSAGTSIGAATDIDVGTGATMSAGTSIGAAGEINVKDGAKVFVNATAESVTGFTSGIIVGGGSALLSAGTAIKTTGGINVLSGGEVGVGGYDSAFTGGIYLASGTTMSAGTSIGAAGKIEVNSNATMTAATNITGSEFIVSSGGSVKATAGSIVATGTESGAIVLEGYAEMIAGTSIGAAKNIDVSDGAKVFVNAADPSTQESAFTGIIVGTNATMSAGTSIGAAGEINVSDGAKVFVNATAESVTGFTSGIIVGGGSALLSAGSAIKTTGGINVLSGGEVGVGGQDSSFTGGIYLSSGTTMSAGTSIGAAGKIEVNSNAKMTAATNITGGAFIVSAGGSVTAATGSIDATSTDSSFTGGIVLGSGATMSAGTSIGAAKNIDVGTNATMSAGALISTDKGISMDATSQITAASIDTNDGIAIDMNAGAATGMSKVIALTTDDTRALKDEITFTNKGETNYFLVYRKTATGGCEYWTTDAVYDYICVNGGWYDSENEYGDELAENRYFGFNASDSGVNAAIAAAEAKADGRTPLIRVVGGEFTTANAPTFNGAQATIIIEGGLFSTSVCGGKHYTSAAEEGYSDDGDIALTVQNTSDSVKPTFNKIFFSGDRIDGDEVVQTRTGDITTVISGGVFNNAVAGAMAITGNYSDCEAELDGNVSLTITGGVFNNISNKGWIYGGCIATNKDYAANSTITGDVTVKLDATANAIAISNLIVGSYGKGIINGNTNLVLKGTNNVTASEIWGGCSSDEYTASDPIGHNRVLNSYVRNGDVSGKRILSFTGFGGTLTSNTNRIYAFSDVVVKENSAATIANSGDDSVNLRDVINWTFENGSTLSGDFYNDFNGDTINLKEFTTPGTFELMYDTAVGTGSKNDIFKEFMNLAEIQLDGDSVGELTKFSDENTMKLAWGTNGESWLQVDKTNGIMSVTIA